MLILEHDMKLKAHLTKRMRDAHWCRFKENLEDLGMRISSSICEADMVTHFLKTRRGADTHVAKTWTWDDTYIREREWGPGCHLPIITN